MMNFKKQISALSVGLLFTLNASAGIPTVDGMAMAQQMAQSLAEMALQEALSEAENKVRQELARQGIEMDKELARLTKEVDGYGWKTDVGNQKIYTTELGSEVNDKNIYISSDSKDLNDEIDKRKSSVNQSFRKKHGLETDVGYMQEHFDSELGYRAMLDDAYSENNSRFETIKKLRELAEQATTPSEKADLEMAIQIEQMAISSEQLRMETIKELKVQEARLDSYRLNDSVYKHFEEQE